MARLAIGSAQFGMHYGISNNLGPTSLDDLKAILSLAKAAGVDLIDTAPGYGDSEQNLGKAFEGDRSFHVVTKVPNLGIYPRHMTGAATRKSVRRSLERLNIHALYGLIAHNADDLLDADGPGLLDTMLELKREGLVRKVGASVYRPDQLDDLLDRYALDLIQLPLNVVDQRFILGGQVAQLASDGLEVHARSVFLQGLLLMNPDQIPLYFADLVPQLSAYHSACSESGLSALEGALGFVRGAEGVTRIVIGVSTARQLAECISAMSRPSQLDYDQFICHDERFTDASRWRIS